ncbi:branched-chain amino acid ABC transporter permease [Tenuibacillus multivorans]|uniref:Branched-chain amino acid transport system permease protein n=1 Tax=Tenuibacillus multivorans TaxID=237069 RepID=A0A1H0G267_9BACI|nr:branched-chain amino acid ABC transporter permease [Tenuibacillus multivorans]GEL78111.1 branched-chain amino acid ABC transporter permease [Tenuibacillus multivorans]SDO00983.1 branched-chain amino acid transport system permease protein [Tenuibacillus multivorans]
MIKTLQKSTWVYLFTGLMLVLLPFFKDERWFLFLMIQIFVFGIFAMSYDLLLGYTGIVSFGHAMFFGVGAYSVAITLDRFEPSFMSLLLGIVIAMAVGGLIAFIAGILTLRLKSHYYAMLTLALANLFLVLAEKWRSLTKGNDGFTFQIPELPGGLEDHRNMVIYLFCLVSMVVIFFGLKRLTESPLGKILVAIRENEQRVVSLGYKIMPYKVIISVISGVVASFAGVLYAISIRFVDTSVFAIDMTLDALLMTIIGGVGTLVGPIIGAGIIEFAHHYLSELSDVHWIFERWIILFGILYILVVIFFPSGIVGTINHKLATRKQRKKEDEQSDKLAS